MPLRTAMPALLRRAWHGAPTEKRVKKRHGGCLAGTENVTVFAGAPHRAAVTPVMCQDLTHALQHRAAFGRWPHLGKRAHVGP
jgi:hypothetical protein